MLKTDAVLQVLWDFYQPLVMKGVLISEPNLSSVPLEAEQRVFTLFENFEYLSLKEIEDLTKNEKDCLSGIFTQYIMFFTMFSDLLFPDSFLDGSSKKRLGKSFLRYMAEHRWPFPQMKNGS